MLLRLAYLGLTNTFTLLRLLPTSSRNKDIEILALRHQLGVLQRQLGGTRPQFTPADRMLLAALLHRLPLQTLHRLRLLVRPDTILRWHRDLLRRRHARMSRPKRPGRPRTIRSIRVLVLRLAKENPSWGYRRIHGELLGIKVAASTVWQILTDAGIKPAPHRASSTWAQFLRSQADALLARDFFETVTLTGIRMYVLVVIEHAQRRIRILGATPHPTAAWVTQAARNLIMDLEDASSRAKFMIRDRDGKFPALCDAILADTGIQVVLTGVQTPHHRSEPNHPSRHPPTPTIRWHPQRVPPRRLTSTDDIFGKRSVDAIPGVDAVPVSVRRDEWAHELAPESGYSEAGRPAPTYASPPGHRSYGAGWSQERRPRTIRP